MSDYIKLLPKHLIKRYKSWKLTEYQKNKSWFNKVALKTEKPKAMIISCCDSRTNAILIFKAYNGEFFVHSNIANLVPPYKTNGDSYGTSAAVEYAVKSLKISNIIIMGHSNCGGIRNGYKLFQNKKNFKNLIFLKKWLHFLKPAFKKIIKKHHNFSNQKMIKELEKESIIISINNLKKFPFIKKLIINKRLVIHGVWHDIRSGNIESLDPKTMNFIKI